MGAVDPDAMYPGRYGSENENTDASCDGPCERGYFCPAGSDSKFENNCGFDVSTGELFPDPGAYCPPVVFTDSSR